jgi:hypothetical protein
MLWWVKPGVDFTAENHQQSGVITEGPPSEYEAKRAKFLKNLFNFTGKISDHIESTC